MLFRSLLVSESGDQAGADAGGYASGRVLKTSDVSGDASVTERWPVPVQAIVAPSGDQASSGESAHQGTGCEEPSSPTSTISCREPRERRAKNRSPTGETAVTS